MKIKGCLLALSSVLLLNGCATIVGDKTQLIPISSTPSDATILITDEKGVQVYKGQTPTSVVLQKSDGSYWGGKDFVLQISKPGYEQQQIQIKSSVNGWYIAGNLVFGGLIGWFILDPLNGGMYTLSPDQITSTLGEAESAKLTGNDGTLSIVLVQDVPDSLKPHMVKLN